MKITYYYRSPIGTLCLEEDDSHIVGLHLDRNATPSDSVPSPLLLQAKIQLDEYFTGKRTTFTLPLKTHGSEFQEKVWAALKLIPYGTTCSYGDIAKAIGQPKASQAVGGANNKNPIMILIPCHRVIGANGSLVGFGCGLDVKEHLLTLERKHCR